MAVRALPTRPPPPATAAVGFRSPEKQQRQQDTQKRLLPTCICTWLVAITTFSNMTKRSVRHYRGRRRKGACGIASYFISPTDRGTRPSSFYITRNSLK